MGLVMEMRKTMRSRIAAQSRPRDPHQDPSRALVDLHGRGQGLRIWQPCHLDLLAPESHHARPAHMAPMTAQIDCVLPVSVWRPHK
jgi:hypothetical protein